MLKRTITVILLTLCTALLANAHEPSIDTSGELLLLQGLQVNGALPALANGITDLKFSELFKMPVGSRGMESSAKLLSLDNKPVRIVGYMAKQETPTPGLFILTPLPVNMGDEDDKFADDMPANSIFVHVDNPDALVLYTPGLINLTGLLSLGKAQEVDGRISYVRVHLDPVLSSLNVKESHANNH